MFLFITIVILMTTYIISSDMPDNSKNAYYVSVLVVTLLVILMKVF